MLTMNFSELQRRKQRTSRQKREQESASSDWQISKVHNASFDCLTVCSSAMVNVTEVASVDTIAERFLEGGGSIVQGKLHIPGVGTLITCRDTIGQLFSFIEAEVAVRPERVRI